MCRPPKWAFVLVFVPLVLGCLPPTPAAASETDQFTMPVGREFADLGDFFTRWMHGKVERAVERTNARIDQLQAEGRAEDAAALGTPEAIADAVNAEFPWAGEVIGMVDVAVQSEALRRRYPGKLPAYRPQVTIRQYFFPLHPANWMTDSMAAPTIRVGDTYFGTDKIGHFTDMGMNYYRAYRRSLRGGATVEQAERAAALVGTEGIVLTETGFLGMLTAGAYSNADLTANYAGHLFYRNLTEPVTLKGESRPPMLERDGPYWRFAPGCRADTNWFTAFVSDHFNEALNPSLYQDVSRPALRQAVAERAAACLQFYADPDGNPRPREWFEAKRLELRTYFGRDYGHRGSESELVTIANTCFGADGAPRVAGTAGGAALEAPSATMAGGRSTGDAGAFGTTPLHTAAAAGDAAGVRRLIEAGAAVDARDQFGRSPLHDAARSGREGVIRLLLEAGAGATAADAYGVTPLHLACRAGRPENARVLLAAGADANARAASGATPLHEAAVSGDTATARLLLLSAGADPAARDGRGRSAADVARAKGFARAEEIIRAPYGRPEVH